jgi:hypothetical protein
MNGHELPDATAAERTRWFQKVRADIAIGTAVEHHSALMALADAVEALYARQTGECLHTRPERLSPDEAPAGYYQCACGQILFHVDEMIPERRLAGAGRSA